MIRTIFDDPDDIVCDGVAITIMTRMELLDFIVMMHNTMTSYVAQIEAAGMIPNPLFVEGSA